MQNTVPKSLDALATCSQTVQENPANARVTRDNSACMKAPRE